ncbi:facilitated trehalose transporter Tret1-like [Condylostylus longicornis]|uniref:facilitated trehalose transporter Tret1-like n=1 Tax=Condylostylus longicornis TaxID=2530218 RepID=UPI00244DED74|nr:facilitated trehalose transporter Tret1-like [Condylostylus longicornis]XP_055376002.1 facilitated trehalose transporter Tret1-like [Condylostylus longicornis]XP_055376003.1 facilitated trehalose transporter Tret1-like [Condylostylus longicornis]XP_055376004.1 facilitated trehalose transporter Tret1-like [Condylostylus longicornis]
MLQESSAKNQYLATIAVNILTFSYGLFCGWLSPAIARLTSPASAMETGPINNEDISWIGASLCIGGFFGNFVYGWLNRRFGRKACLLITAAPLFFSWTAVIFGRRIIHLCVARFLGGFAASGVFSLVPVYVTEISQDRIRGALGSYFIMAINAGILIAFVTGTYMTYRTNPYMLSVPVLVFVLVFAFIPETPQHLLKVKADRKAEKSYLFYRNYKYLSKEVNQQFISEMQCLKDNNCTETTKNTDDDSDQMNAPLKLSDFTNRAARKSIIISLFLMFLSQFCGAFAMINYTALIFYESGSSMPPELAAMVVAGIQVIGSYFSIILIERSGRKMLLIVSAFGCCFGTFTLGIYTLIKSYNVNMQGYEWIPIFSLSFVIFIAAWGVLAIHFLVMSEITPPKIINVISPICVAAMFFFGFVTVKGLPVFNEAFGLHVSMFIFSICSFLGGIFIILYLPETKGKSINEILDILSK